MNPSIAAAAYLPILATLIPEGTQYKDRASPFFKIAIAVFRLNHASGLLTEDALSSYFSEWSGLLLSFCGQPKIQFYSEADARNVANKDQCVGRGIVDEGLLGLIKLLKLCASLLDCSKSSLESR